MPAVAIVDYGLSNIDSVRRAVEECGGRPTVVDEPAALRRADRVILPGVGAFPDAMRRLRDTGLAAALTDAVLGDGAPFLGICLGMQLIATVGHEGSETLGLGWLDAEVERLVPTEQDRRIPHMGWNEVRPRCASPLFEGVGEGTDFYFVHSFHVKCKSASDVIGTTPYCGGFASAVGRDGLWGVQFHPEKSQRAGFRVLRNFIEYSC